jgi:hypothetical protein
VGDSVYSALTIDDPDPAPIPVTPSRPARPLGTIAFLKTVATNSLSAFDEELFDELVVPRRYLWQRVLFVSDPEGIKRVFLDNVDNYPRFRHIRRLFQAGLGTGSLGTEGETWWRHRRISPGPIIGRHARRPGDDRVDRTTHRHALTGDDSQVVDLEPLSAIC